MALLLAAKGGVEGSGRALAAILRTVSSESTKKALAALSATETTAETMVALAPQKTLPRPEWVRDMCTRAAGDEGMARALASVLRSATGTLAWPETNMLGGELKILATAGRFELAAALASKNTKKEQKRARDELLDATTSGGTLEARMRYAQLLHMLTKGSEALALTREDAAKVRTMETGDALYCKLALPETTPKGYNARVSGIVTGMCAGGETEFRRIYIDVWLLLDSFRTVANKSADFMQKLAQHNAEHIGAIHGQAKLRAEIVAHIAGLVSTDSPEARAIGDALCRAEGDTNALAEREVIAHSIAKASGAWPSATMLRVIAHAAKHSHGTEMAAIWGSVRKLSTAARVSAVDVTEETRPGLLKWLKHCNDKCAKGGVRELITAADRAWNTGFTDVAVAMLMSVGPDKLAEYAKGTGMYELLACKPAALHGKVPEQLTLMPAIRRLVSRWYRDGSGRHTQKLMDAVHAIIAVTAQASEIAVIGEYVALAQTRQVTWAREGAEVALSPSATPRLGFGMLYTE
ncbi:MAG: hypothetical protein WCK17_12715 [Verrucomicrobiota bacterium]